jgi:hypothetical protein
MGCKLVETTIGFHESSFSRHDTRFNPLDLMDGEKP